MIVVLLPSRKLTHSAVGKGAVGSLNSAILNCDVLRVALECVRRIQPLHTNTLFLNARVHIGSARHA